MTKGQISVLALAQANTTTFELMKLQMNILPVQNMLTRFEQSGKKSA